MGEATKRLLAHADEGIFTNLCHEIKNLVGGGSTIASDPEMRDCLVSLSTEYIQFSWKDEMIERLAPFRRFLLGEFGSYNRAWLYMTRTKTFTKSKGHENLKH